jgi:hypothetical protein
MISGEPMGLRSRDIIEFIKPEKVFSIPALGIEDITDFDMLSKKLVEIVDVVQI